MTTTCTRPPPALLRALRPGDLGWVIARHGTLYAQEYGFNQHFEAMVARIAADYVDQLDPAHECAVNIATVNRLMQVVDRLESSNSLEQAMGEQDAVTAQAIVQAALAGQSA